MSPPGALTAAPAHRAPRPQGSLEGLREFYAPYNEQLFALVERAGLVVLPRGGGRAFL